MKNVLLKYSPVFVFDTVTDSQTHRQKDVDIVFKKLSIISDRTRFETRVEVRFPTVVEDERKSKEIDRCVYVGEREKKHKRE